MANRWLLIETFGPEDREPSVIAKGRVPLGMVPLASVMGRSRYLEQLRDHVVRAARSGTEVKAASPDGMRQLLCRPLADFSGHVNGVQAWIGVASEQPPARDLVGAWYFNLSTGRIGGSHELLDLYGVPMDQRREQKRVAEAFVRLLPHADQGSALAILARRRPGDTHQATWVVRRDDGEERAVNLACRVVEDRLPGGRTEIVLRGVTHDVGQPGASSSAPKSILFERSVLLAERLPGRSRAVVDPRTLGLLRWVDEPLAELAWTGNGAHQPEIHPEDLAEALRMAAAFARVGRTGGPVRLRAEAGGWLAVDVTASRVSLDEETSAALVILTRLDEDRSDG